MLAAPKNEMAGTVSFAGLTDAVVVAAGQWSAQRCTFTVETFFFNGDTVVKTQLFTEKFLAPVLQSYE